MSKEWRRARVEEFTWGWGVCYLFVVGLENGELVAQITNQVHLRRHNKVNTGTQSMYSVAKTHVNICEGKAFFID